MLLTRASEMGIQCVVYLAGRKDDGMVTPQFVAGLFHSSPSYMSKVLQMLARARVLESQRGASGGFKLTRNPNDLTLLDVVEACQGAIAGNYCKELNRRELLITCGYHQAMVDLQDAVKEALSRWTIADVVEKGCPPPESAPLCKLRSLCDPS